MTTRQQVEAVLSRNGYKQRGDSWQGKAFWRNGDNETSIHVTFTGDEHGMFKDFARNDGGSLYEFCDLIGIERPQRIQPETSKRVYTGLEEYAILHGAKSEWFTDAGWIEDTKNGRKAIRFNTASGYRWRFLDEQQPRFIHESGYVKCWYGFDRAIARAKSDDEPIVMVNGEASVIVATGYGIPAFCVTSGEGALPDNLLNDLKTRYRGKVILAFDADEKGKQAAEAVANQLKDYELSIFDNGLSGGGDIADFCKLHGKRSWAFILGSSHFKKPDLVDLTRTSIQELAQNIDILTQAVRFADRKEQAQDLQRQLAKVQAQVDRIAYNQTAPKVIDIYDLGLIVLDELNDPNAYSMGLSTGIKKLDGIIGGLSEAEITIIYGSSGMGKSTLMTSIASHLRKTSAGIVIPTELLSKKWYMKMVSYDVNIPAGDILRGNMTAAQRDAVIGAVRSHKGYERILFVDIPSPTTNEIRAAVLDALARHDYKWLMIDSVTNVSGRGNGVQEKQTEVLDAILDLARETGLPIIGTSQVDRQVSERANKIPQMTDAYGSSAIERNADNILSMYYHHEYVIKGTEQPHKDLPEGVVLFKANKTRWGSPGQQLTALFKGGIGIYDMEVKKLQ